jgi:hypothetical protein
MKFKVLCSLMGCNSAALEFNGNRYSSILALLFTTVGISSKSEWRHALATKCKCDNIRPLNRN